MRNWRVFPKPVTYVELLASQIFGDLKMQLARFLVGGFEYCIERNRTRANSLYGIRLIWRYLHDLPILQIKTIIKYTMYMVVRCAKLIATFNAFITRLNFQSGYVATCQHKFLIHQKFKTLSTMKCTHLG